MPHVPAPEPAYEWELGAQWREDADWSTSKTSTSRPWRAGRGYTAPPEPTDASIDKMIDDMIDNAVVDRSKRPGTGLG